jgi:hypothetical protein
MDGNENPLENSANLHLCKQSARVCLQADLHILWNMASLTPSILSGVGAESVHPFGLLSFNVRSWHHFDTHNSQFLQLGASCLRNCWREPWHVAVTDSVLINSSTAAMRCCTDQCSISTKHQTSLYMITVSIWKWCVVGTLVLKFQKPSDIFDTPCTRESSWNPNSDTVDHAALPPHLVLFTTTFVFSYIHSCKEKFGAHIKVLLFNFFTISYKECAPWNSVFL